MLHRGLSLAVVLGACLVFAGLHSSAEAQGKKGKSRLASTGQIMSGVVQPTCAALGAGLKKDPADDKGWKQLATRAAVLNELSYTIMEDGRCPDANWAKAAKTLRDCSAVIVQKVKAKDRKAAEAAFKEMTKACAACHKAHKKG